MKTYLKEWMERSFLWLCIWELWRQGEKETPVRHVEVNVDLENISVSSVPPMTESKVRYNPTDIYGSTMPIPTM